jgi:3-mercaptopyruvate sulfurtransferase SseA
MPFWRRTFARAAILVGVSALMGLIHNYVFSFEGIRLNESPLQRVSDLEAARFIQLEEAKEKWNQKALFLDARAEEFYTYEGHIQGAISLPYVDFERAYREVRGELFAKDQEIVVYCSGFGCEESAELAKLLVDRGVAGVLVYEGGWPEWLESGLPVDMPSQ